MEVIKAVNINDAWGDAREELFENHVVRPSRVGEVWEYPGPVTTVYWNPAQRVLFDPKRNANHFFHFMEALHMLAGRRDVAWLEQFNSKIRDFVGKDDLQHAAYGHRLRLAFDLDGGAEDDYADQLPKVARMLAKDKNERRAVLCIWNPLWDLERPDISDIPCNDIIFLKIREGALDMTVCCRSNDIIFGCYGSNIVQFSTLQEYLAAMIGVPMGFYYQVSDSWHAYTERWEKLAGNPPYNYPPVDYYSDASPSQPNVNPFPLVRNPDTFDEELQRWMARDGIETHTWDNYYFPLVAEPLWQAHKAYRTNDLEKALEHARHCQATDWRIGVIEWLERIRVRRASKEDYEAEIKDANI